jgi:hypothetical protein
MVEDFDSWWIDDVPDRLRSYYYVLTYIFRMEKLRGLLYTKSDLPVVVYIHW